MQLDAKVEKLSSLIADLQTVAVAFSGGTDSALLLAFSVRVLGPEKVLAVTADSATLPRSELAEAREIAAELGVNLVCVATEEVHDQNFASNPPDRCYYCKKSLQPHAR